MGEQVSQGPDGSKGDSGGKPDGQAQGDPKSGIGRQQNKFTSKPIDLLPEEGDEQK